MQQIQCSQVVNSCSTEVDEGRHETVFQRVPPASLEQCAGWYGHLVLHCRVLRECPSTPSGVLDHKLVAPRALLFQQDGQPKIKFSQGQGLPTTMGLQYPRRLRIPWCEGLQTTLQAAGPLNLAPSRLDHPSLKDYCPKFAMEGRWSPHWNVGSDCGLSSGPVLVLLRSWGYYVGQRDKRGKVRNCFLKLYRQSQVPQGNPRAHVLCISHKPVPEVSRFL